MTPTTAIKRRERDQAEQSPPVGFKRQKHLNIEESNVMHETIRANELASAFALASLATMSPARQGKTELVYESRDADHGQDAIPVSPDVRSPDRSPHRRVSFSNDTKVTSRLTSRKLSFPPRLKPQESRMPSGFARGSFPSRAQQHLPPPWINQRMMARPASVFMPPPPMMSPPPSTSDKWICDFCNVAAFETYQEACNHEDSCRIRCRMQQQRASGWHPMPPPRPALNTYSPNNVMIHSPPPASAASLVRSESRAWFQLNVSLAIPDMDRKWLSGLNCFIRARCVEAFTATEDDVSKISKHGHPTLHQVGIRCRFCSQRPKEDMQAAALSYPASVAGIFDSVKRWQKVHLELCEDVPHDVMTKIEGLASTNTWIPTTRQYWADSARSKGMIDTQDGIRFSVDPARGPDCSVPDYQSGIARSHNDPPQEIETMIVIKTETEASPDGNNDHLRAEDHLLAEGGSIVRPEDVTMIPPYVYFLMCQVESTRFTEADRFVARSKGPIGYSGFQCRHCHGHAGLGKYFPISAKSLSTNSTSQNIHSHLLKCRKVTPHVKEKLIVLKEEKSKAPRFEPGWRRIFFEKVWSRLHG